MSDNSEISPLKASRNKEVFLYFLKLGATGFGGPLALVSIMQKELVEDRKWIPLSDYLKALAMIKAMPGTLAFQMAVFLGRHRAGLMGGTLAAFGLIAPSFVLMVLFAQYYESAQAILGFRPFFNGMQAGAIVLMIQALRSLAMPYFKSLIFWCFFIIGGVSFYRNLLAEPFLILFSGLCGVMIGQVSKPRVSAFFFPFVTASVVASSTRLMDLAWLSFKSGAVIFGSGLAIVPLLAKEFVDKTQWVSNQEFMDALAIGQITPGPVLITITFLGFRIEGLLGAITATVGVFAASFFHMQTWFPRALDYLSRQKWVTDFLRPALGSICGVLAVTIFRLTLPWSGTNLYFILFICMVLAIWLRLQSWMLILLGGLLSIGLSFF